MIAPLRRRHAVAWVVIGLSLPVGYVAALAARRDIPRVDAPDDVAGETLWTRSRALAAVDVDLAARRTTSGTELLLTPHRPLARPDVLVYWLPPGAEPVPRPSVLLGAFAGDAPASFPLPVAADEGRLGTVLLYSLGHQTDVDSAALGGGDAR